MPFLEGAHPRYVEQWLPHGLLLRRRLAAQRAARAALQREAPHKEQDHGIPEARGAHNGGERVEPHTVARGAATDVMEVLVDGAANEGPRRPAHGIGGVPEARDKPRERVVALRHARHEVGVSCGVAGGANALEDHCRDDTADGVQAVLYGLGEAKPGEFDGPEEGKSEEEEEETERLDGFEDEDVVRVAVDDPSYRDGDEDIGD